MIYQPPEVVLKNRSKNAGTDIWSIGVILYQLIYGKLPFDKDIYLSRGMCNKTELEFDNKVVVSNELKELLKSMLEKDPNRRISMYKLMTLNWFEMSDRELQNKVKTLQDIQDALLKQKEQTKRKAALRGNK